MAEIVYELEFQKAQSDLIERGAMSCPPELKAALESCMKGIEKAAKTRGATTWVTSPEATSSIFNDLRNTSPECTGISPVLMVQTGEIDAFFMVATEGRYYWLWSSVREAEAEPDSKIWGPFDHLDQTVGPMIANIVSVLHKSGGKISKREQDRRHRQRVIRLLLAVCYVAAGLVGGYGGWSSSRDPFLAKVEEHIYDDVPLPRESDYECYLRATGINCIREKR